MKNSTSKWAEIVSPLRFLGLISANALASNWVVPEVWAALGNDPKNQSHRVIPVKIGESSLPTPLDQLHAIDARGGITPLVLESILSITRQ